MAVFFNVLHDSRVIAQYVRDGNYADDLAVLRDGQVPGGLLFHHADGFDERTITADRDQRRAAERFRHERRAAEQRQCSAEVVGRARGRWGGVAGQRRADQRHLGAQPGDGGRQLADRESERLGVGVAGGDWAGATAASPSRASPRTIRHRVPRRRIGILKMALPCPVFRERQVPRMLELATARAEGDTSVPAELGLYPARSRSGKQSRLS